MTDEEYKQLDRRDLEDEIISILFNYLIAENEEKDKIIEYLKKIKGSDSNE